MKVKNIIKKAVGLSTVTMMLSTNILFTSNFIIEELISYAQESEIKIASNTEQQENLENIVLSATQELVSNFAIEEEKINIIQTKIAVNLEGNIYKPQTMQIHLNENIVPNVAPTKILVRSLKNTNYSSLALDKTEGTKIIASNTAKEEALPGEEEFLITYVYNYINENNPVSTETLDVKINKVEVTLQGENLVKTIENQTTTLETTQIESNGINLIPEIVNDLGKGYLNMGQTENFEEKTTIIAEPEMLAGSSIIIEDLGNTIFANNGKEEVETEIKSNIIKTTISKQQLANYLGEGYKIELVEDEQQEGTEETQEKIIAQYPIETPEEEIMEIQEEKPVQETEQMITEDEQKIIITYPENTFKYKIKLTKGNIEPNVIPLGMLEIKTNKQIPAQEKTVVDTLSTISTNVKTKLVKGAIELEKATAQTKEIAPISSQAQMHVLNSVNNTNTFSAGKNIADVSIILKTDTSTSKLYTNPVITIHRPENIKINEITNLNITNNGAAENQIFEETLQTIEGITTIILLGEQTQYNTELENVTINFQMQFETEEEIIDINDEKIIATIANTNGGVIEAVNIEDTINVIAEEQLFIKHNILASEKIAVAEDTITIGKSSEPQEIIFENNIVNNTNEEKQNLEIYGKVPLTEQGATIKEVNCQNAKIYFTANPEATLDIENAQNGWAELANIEAGAEIKLYLIKLDTIDAKQIEDVKIALNIPAEIPANEESTYTRNIVINGVAQGEEQTIKCYTPSELDITATIETDKETYFQGEEISYTVKVTNNSTTVAATGVNVEKILPENLQIMSEPNGENLHIPAGQTIEFPIKIKVPENAEEGEVTLGAKIAGEGLEEIKLEKTIKIKASTIKTEISYYINEKTLTGEEILKAEDGIFTEIKIVNQTKDTKIENLKVTYKCNDFNIRTAFIKEGSIKDKFEKVEYADGQAIFKGELNAESRCKLHIYSGVNNNYTANILQSEIIVEYDENGEHKTKTYTQNFNAQEIAKIEATLESSKANKELVPGEEIEYKLTVKNTGGTEDYVTINSNIPTQLTVQKITEVIGETREFTNASNGFTVSFSIEPNQTVEYYFLAKVKEDAKSGNIENCIEISSLLTNEFYTNKIKNTIKGTTDGETPDPTPENPQDPSQDPNPNTPQNPENPTPSTFAITGTSWIDRDENGTKDKTDANIKGVLVKIIDVSTGNYLKDSKGEILTQITGNNGEYSFNNLQKGKYIIEFEYNNDTYYLIKAAQNVTVSNITTQEGTKTRSEVINIENANIENVNIALAIRDERFDLALNKYITKITVTNKGGTTIYENLRENLAKIEIDKKYMVGSSIAIEYTIEVTNQGSVPGKATKILDYIPDGMEFNSELNPAWYQDTNGALYSTSLANQEIVAGETKTITLILTKTLGSTAKVDISNTAEIAEHHNVELLNDKDSIPANNKQEEDDQSIAQLIISIKTGELTYTFLIIICSTILIAGTIAVKKYVI